MGQRYARLIRKAINANYRTAFEEVRIYIESKAQSANFFQRLRIAVRYVFKKDFNAFFVMVGYDRSKDLLQLRE